MWRRILIRSSSLRIQGAARRGSAPRRGTREARQDDAGASASAPTGFHRCEAGHRRAPRAVCCPVARLVVRPDHAASCPFWYVSRRQPLWTPGFPTPARQLLGHLPEPRRNLFVVRGSRRENDDREPRWPFGIHGGAQDGKAPISALCSHRSNSGLSILRHQYLRRCAPLFVRDAPGCAASASASTPARSNRRSSSYVTAGRGAGRVILSLPGKATGRQPHFARSSARRASSHGSRVASNAADPAGGTGSRSSRSTSSRTR